MRLYKIKDDRYGVLYGERYVVGTLEEIREIMESSPNLVDPDDIDAALDEMEKRNHNIADFGVAGYFILTSTENKEAA